MGDLETAVAKLGAEARRAAADARYVPTPLPIGASDPWPRVDGIPPLCPFGVALSADGRLRLGPPPSDSDPWRLYAVADGVVVLDPDHHTTAGLAWMALGLTRGEQQAVGAWMGRWDRGEVDGAELRALFAPDDGGRS